MKKVKSKDKKVSLFEKYFLRNFRVWNNLQKPMPLKKNFDNYNEYWLMRGFHEPSLKRAKIISKNINSGLRILDIGCGDGTIIDFIFKNNSPSKIVGIDISKEAVNYTKKRGYEAYKMDVFSQEFIDFLNKNEFDYIIITEVLEHVIDSEKVILTLKKYSYRAIFISIPNSGFYLHRIRLLLGYFPIVMINVHIKEHLRFWTHNDFLQWCSFFGFEVNDFWVSSGYRKFGINFYKLRPSLFAEQIIYKIKKTNNNK